MQDTPATIFLRLLSLLGSLACPLFFALPPQKFPVNLRDLFEAIFHLVIILDPAPNPIYLLGRNNPAGRMSASKRDSEIPHWPMPLAFGALAGGISAGDVPFHQRASQGLGHGRTLLSQILPALAQGGFRKPSQIVICFHLSESIPVKVYRCPQTRFSRPVNSPYDTPAVIFIGVT